MRQQLVQLKNNGLTLSVLTLAFLFAAFVAYVSFPYRTVEVKRFFVASQVVRPGEKLTYTVDYCLYTKQEFDIIRTLIEIAPMKPETDKIIIELNQRKGVHVKPGCGMGTASNIIIPDNTPTGYYRLKFDVLYHVTPFRSIPKSFQSEPFPIMRHGEWLPPLPRTSPSEIPPKKTFLERMRDNLTREFGGK